MYNGGYAVASPGPFTPPRVLVSTRPRQRPSAHVLVRLA